MNKRVTQIGGHSSRRPHQVHLLPAKNMKLRQQVTWAHQLIETNEVKKHSVEGEFRNSPFNQKPSLPKNTQKKQNINENQIKESFLLY